ncbi:hypothetical protein GCM10022233_40270 [Streptomyces shaanxiensis]|uniref:Uncharacterized protein n=1 Tax=Streptomyces shaanxiensis TaxID=653357 RepID=A0ABP7V9E1_9ACTN
MYGGGPVAVAERAEVVDAGQREARSASAASLTRETGKCWRAFTEELQPGPPAEEADDVER